MVYRAVCEAKNGVHRLCFCFFLKWWSLKIFHVLVPISNILSTVKLNHGPSLFRPIIKNSEKETWSTLHSWRNTFLWCWVFVIFWLEKKPFFVASVLTKEFYKTHARALPAPLFLLLRGLAGLIGLASSDRKLLGYKQTDRQ